MKGNSPIYIVVPFKGKFELIERFVQSLWSQLDKDWEAHIVLDNINSVWKEVDHKNWLLMTSNEPRIISYTTSERNGPLHNVYDVIVEQLKDKPDDAIIAQADGDDWLLPDAIKRVRIYHKYCDVTYGQFIRHAPGKEYNGAKGQCKEYDHIVKLNNNYEDAPWVASHLKTFKKKCFTSIPHEMFIDPRTGAFWDSSYDKAYFLPILKMTDNEKIMFNPAPIYVYNMEGWGEEGGGHIDPAVQAVTSEFIIQAVKEYITKEVIADAKNGS